MSFLYRTAWTAALVTTLSAGCAPLDYASPDAVPGDVPAAVDVPATLDVPAPLDASPDTPAPDAGLTDVRDATAPDVAPPPDAGACGASGAPCCTTATPCATGLACQASRCAACPAGQTACSGLCVNTQIDAHNCGGCGQVCATTGTVTNACSVGACQPVCAPGYAACHGATAGCQSTENDAQNCGGCGVMCATNATTPTNTCSASACHPTCSGGHLDCDGNHANGCEADPTTDAHNCGACGAACATTGTTANACTASVCHPTCASGYGDCDSNRANGCETMVNTNANCASCGVACTATEACLPMMGGSAVQCIPCGGSGQACCPRGTACVSPRTCTGTPGSCM